MSYIRMNYFSFEKHEKIYSVDQLIAEAISSNGEYSDFFIMLNFGLRSSKRILYDSDARLFCVHIKIDDSYQDNLTEEDLRNETHIILAIESGALYKY